MLRVTVEIWPGGDKTRARAIAIANVANLSDLAEVSELDVNPLICSPSGATAVDVLAITRAQPGWNHRTKELPEW